MSQRRSAAGTPQGVILAILCMAAGLIAAVVHFGSPTGDTPAPTPDGSSANAARPQLTSALSTVQPIRKPPPPPPSKASLAAQPRASTRPPTSPPDGSGEPIRLPDLRHVDPQQLFSPARRLAKTLEPQAELRWGFPVSTHGDVVGGTIDLTGSSRVSFDFEYRYHDPDQPPGENLVQGSVVVVARTGQMTATREARIVANLPGQENLPDPTCSVVRAWQAAVASGVPPKTAVQVMYYDGDSTQKGGPFLWSFRVAGREELRREINAMTCTLSRSWARQR